MLKEFSVKNFLSFNDEMLFSMEADIGRVSEHGDHVVDINGNKLLKVASVYGPNGGGKTNMLSALKLARILQSNRGIKYANEMPCAFGNDRTIEQTIFFVDEQYEIGYKFSIEPGEDDTYLHGDGIRKHNEIRYNIISEEISYRRTCENDFRSLIERDSFGVLDNENFVGIWDDKLRLAKTKSVVQYIFENFADNDGELPENLDVVKHLAIQIGNIRTLDVFGNITPISTKMDELIDKYENKLVEKLNAVGVVIKGIRAAHNDKYPYYVIREALINGKKVERVMPLDLESRGTRKIFWMFFSMLEFMNNGAIFICDDMNAYLHPKLYRTVIELFQENTTGSQLIFNSHDIINMDNELFRRDEIWFAYRDDNYNSKLVPLSNIVNFKGEQVRKDAKYYKQYLEGKYGADPFIKRGLSWNE